MEPLFRHILVPIDGSEASLGAVDMALRVVQLCPSCRMTVLYVVDNLVLNELARFSGRGEKEAESELEEQGRRYLDLARQDAAKLGIATECETRKGDPFEEIVAAANGSHADLIIMGHTGRRGTTRVLIGSVTQRVLDYAPCPVLVTR
ncbi:MAG TPA: universal stress protein [Bryobacteraceae bacterium]|nr:universal stress protein [Bryobacteraceae bacterium]